MDLSSDLKLYFLGTGSQKPSPTRNVTSIALILESGHYILFDCGEGTQHQILRSTLSLSNINTIFITHLHGDHIFGLPGLLCSLNEILSGREFTIYGPTGLLDYLKATLFNRLYCILQYKLNVIEFNSTMDTGIIDPVITLEGISRNEQGYEIKSFPVKHTSVSQGNTYGFIIKQDDQNIKFKNPDQSGLFNFMQKNESQVVDWIKSITGNEQNYRSALGILQRSETPLIINDDELGEINIRENERFVDTPKRGTCICLIIDSSDSSFAIEALAGKECDVLIHESTNAKTSLDGDKSYQEIEEETLRHGHSTPQLAGALARRINTKQLVLTHFSSRYQGDISEENLSIMEEIRTSAVETYGSNSVITARDFMEINIQKSKEESLLETAKVMQLQIGKESKGGFFYDIKYE